MLGIQYCNLSIVIVFLHTAYVKLIAAGIVFDREHKKVQLITASWQKKHGWGDLFFDSSAGLVDPAGCESNHVKMAWSPVTAEHGADGWNGGAPRLGWHTRHCHGAVRPKCGPPLQPTRLPEWVESELVKKVIIKDPVVQSDSCLRKSTRTKDRFACPNF